MTIFRSLCCFLMLTYLLRAENIPGAPDPATIEHKVMIKADQELFFRFKAEGNKLLDPQNYQGKHDDPQMVKVEIMVGGPAPGRVLVVNNQFRRTLNFRVLERLEGKPEFAKLRKDVIKLGPGQQWCHFTPEKSRITEAVLYQFTLSDEHLNKQEE